MQDIKKPSHNLRFRNTNSNTKLHKERHAHINDSGLRDFSSQNSEENYFDFNNYKHKKTDIDSKLDAFEKRIHSYSQKNTYNKDNPKVIRLKNNIIKVIVAIFIFILFIILYFLLTYVFNSAKITIIPEKKTISIDKEIIVKIDNQNVKVLENSLENSATLPKSELQKIVSKARGEITIYNNFNSSKQKLIKNTRFKSSEGKIFRLIDSIEIPAMNGITPGKITVEVIADGIGESYNINPDKFTIPGFEGTDRYRGFYGVSETPMLGGADGNKYIVAKEDIDNVNLVKEKEIIDKLISSVNISETNNYIIATSTAVYSFENNLYDYEYNRIEDYKLKGTVNLLYIDREYLGKKIAESAIDNYNQEKIKVSNFDNLEIRLSQDNLPALSSLKDITDIKLYIKGDIELSYIINENLIKDLFVSESLETNNFNKILQKIKNINDAKSKIFPPWADKYPSNREKIEVILENQ